MLMPSFSTCVKGFGFNTAADMIMIMVRCTDNLQLCFKTAERNITVSTDTFMSKSYVRMFEAYIHMVVNFTITWRLITI